MNRIRLATPDDASKIARLHVGSWRESYADLLPDRYLRSISFERKLRFWSRVIGSGEWVFLACDGDLPVGFASAGRCRAEDAPYGAEVYMLYVLRRHQRRGHGTRLLEASRYWLSSVGYRGIMLWVLAQNPACGFYEAMGGETVAASHERISGELFRVVAYGWSNPEPAARPEVH